MVGREAVGLIIGFIFGATNIIRFGPGPNGMMRTLGQYMLGSAATFGYKYLISAKLQKLILLASSCLSVQPSERTVRLS